MIDLAIFNNNLFILVILPIISAILIAIFKRHNKIIDTIYIIFAFLFLLATLNVAHQFINNKNSYLDLLEIFPYLTISLATEPLSIIFSLVIAVLWFFTTIYSVSYMRQNKEANIARFYIFFCLAIFATTILCFSKNLFTLFIAYELITISTYPLVTHKMNQESRKSGRYYIGILMSTSIGFLLPVMIIIWNHAGTLEFINGGIINLNKINNNLLLICYVLTIYGFSKAALMPFHKWLPKAMIAPTPVSALLHAVAVVKAGVFSIIKVTCYIFGIKTLIIFKSSIFINFLLIMASFTIICSAIIACKSESLKQILAYSTIGQLSYMIMAVIIITPFSPIIAMIYVISHAFAKIVLFFTVGAIYTAHKKTKVSEIKGLFYQMPFTIIMLIIASISIAGLPPTFGFWAKAKLVSIAALDHNILILVTIFIGTILSTIYLGNIIIQSLSSNNMGKLEIQEAPYMMLLPIFACIIILLYLFFNNDIILRILIRLIT